MYVWISISRFMLVCMSAAPHDDDLAEKVQCKSFIKIFFPQEIENYVKQSFFWFI